MKNNYRRQNKIKSTLLFFILLIVAILFIAPVIIVFIISFKTITGIGVSLFNFPSGEYFAGLDNYLVGLTFGNYPFLQAFYSRQQSLWLPYIAPLLYLLKRL